MPTFSLIVPTFGRANELARLFTSLVEQFPVSFEVIIVDQNDDERVTPYLNLLGNGITTHHIRVSKKNLSNARNVGLAYATGEYVAFPDDDCWYPPQLLSEVERWFAVHCRYDILAVAAQDEAGLSSGNRWPQQQCDIRPHNSLRTTFSNSLFLKRRSLSGDILFDEGMLSSEETDYVLRHLRAGCRGRFDRSLHICHPRRDMLSGTVSLQRAQRYGEGMGQLVRRHSLSLLWGALLGYGFVRAAIVAVRGNISGATFCLAHSYGLFRGFFSPGPHRG
jgi:glycosyltransferase involved in cell wall biosynthesis